MSLPTPDEAAKAFLASPEYAEYWTKIAQAVRQDPSWTISQYEHRYSSVHYYSSVGVGDRCDLYGDEVFGDVPDPGHEKRKAATWAWVAMKVLGFLFDGPYVLFWHRVWPKEHRPRDRWESDEHNHKAALLVKEDVKARLSVGPFVGWGQNLFTLLASPEVRAESNRIREEHALSDLDEGIRNLRALGFSDEAITVKMQEALT